MAEVSVQTGASPRSHQTCAYAPPSRPPPPLARRPPRAAASGGDATRPVPHQPTLDAAPLTSACGRMGGDRRQQRRGFAEPPCMPMHQCAPPPAFPSCLCPLLRLGAEARPPERQQGSNSKWWSRGGARLGRLSAEGACCSQPLPVWWCAPGWRGSPGVLGLCRARPRFAHFVFWASNT